MERKALSAIEKLKRKKRIWSSSNGKWRIVQWPFPFILSIERFVRTKSYLKPVWESRDREDADVPKYVIRKLSNLLKSRIYVCNLFNSGY